MAEEEKEPKGKEPEPKPKDRIDVLEETLSKLIDMVEGLTKKVKEVEESKGVKKGGLFGGKRKRTPTKDTKTGTVYPSKAAAAKATAAEYGLDPADSMAWYTIIARDPERFVEASAGEAEVVEAKLKAEQEAARVARQAELDAEEAAKAKAEAEAKPTK